MASSYSTDLKLELMVTGENAGTWGDKTNTNLNLLQQAKDTLESMDSNLLTASKNVTIDPKDPYYTSSSPIVQNLNALKALINA